MSKLSSVVIYTDGACDPNPGSGGWAALLKFGRVEKVVTGHEVRSTNNRMELTAAIEALKSLDSPHRVDIYTDSEYLCKGITEWMPRWIARNWKRKKGKLANVDLWKELHKEVGSHRIKWHWVRGHAGNRLNQRVDRLARKAIKKR